jgi:hypothetical protein
MSYYQLGGSTDAHRGSAAGTAHEPVDVVDLDIESPRPVK